MKICQRYHHDGSRCSNETDYADGWCRESNCPGYLRPDPSRAPESAGAPRGTERHIDETGSLPAGDVTVEDVPTVHVTARALDSFRYHHGGAQTEAEIQLRGMLEDFLLRSARRVSQTGYLVLSREGYELTLSPARDTITGYSTIHRERTWEQVKTGVKSRFKGHGKTREATGPAPEAGPPLQLEQFPNAFDPASVHLTGRVRGSYAKLAGLSWASDEELDGHIREAASHIRQGKVARRGDGMFEIAAADRTWLVSADCQSLVGVKSDALPT